MQETNLYLKQQNISTWFDLGIFLDKLREENELSTVSCPSSLEEYKSLLSEGGIGFATFRLGIDGVTEEIGKYARAFSSLLHEVPIHFIAGRIDPRTNLTKPTNYHTHTLSSLDGFDEWALYHHMFETKLQRGGALYNELIGKLWTEVLEIVNDLGRYIEENDIRLLYLINVCSNPGNVSFALATVLISESMGIPVINNSHDFYWEGGSRKVDIIRRGFKRGPRDFFYKNYDIGEVFSIIEILYPWESRSWMTVGINFAQSRRCIERKGHNPANVCQLGTAVDVQQFSKSTKRDDLDTMGQVAAMLARYQDNVQVYSPEEVLEKSLISETKRDPILIGQQQQSSFEFAYNNILFLQPTRILPRKRIEIGFRLIERLFGDDVFNQIFESNKQLSLTLLVSGPIPLGQFKYIKTLLEAFQDLLRNLPEEFGSRVFLGFLFSEFDTPEFKERYSKPLGIPQLYSISSLILLPSDTEGRGLPIIEATACGRPIFCRRYYPEHVYAEVIGEHLPESDRLKVMEYLGKRIRDSVIRDIALRVFFPQNFIDEVEHNQKVIEKRFSFKSLEQDLDSILQKLHGQLQPNEENVAAAAQIMEEYRALVRKESALLPLVISTEKRQYIPGFCKSAFMVALKSLIDPSFFRVEEQFLRGYILRFATRLIELSADPASIRAQTEKLRRFYNIVDSLFLVRSGELDILHDHSLAYRHRNRLHYPFRDFTHQELTGVVNLLFHQIFSPSPEREVVTSGQFFTDWKLALFQLTNSAHLGIDERERLMTALSANVPVAYFPGRYLKYEIEFFVLQPIRKRLGLSIDEELTQAVLDTSVKNLHPAYIFCREQAFGRYFTAETMTQYLQTSNSRELRLLVDNGLCKVVPTKQYSVGLHLGELGEDACNVLNSVKQQNGILITNGQTAAVMTDTLNIDRFHIGKARNGVIARMLGIPHNSGFIAFVPAGLRATLAYPVPVQTTKSLSDALQSDVYLRLCQVHGEEKVLQLLREDAEQGGSPVEQVLEKLDRQQHEDEIPSVSYRSISGVYDDGHPWSGVLAKVNIANAKKVWKFTSVAAGEKTKTVSQFTEEFEAQEGKPAEIAWNGGYILNPELVGKLGLGEACIGSPLGLIVSNGKVLGLPLFDKPSLFIYPNGELAIRRFNCRDGFLVTTSKGILEFTSQCYNSSTTTSEELAYFDLLYENEHISGDGRIVVQLSGNKIHSITPLSEGKKISCLPIGITLLVPKEKFPKEWNAPDAEIDISIPSLEGASNVIEAGPELVRDGKVCIDMGGEGWKHPNSIRTQAARLDYTDMRGPKIAAGLDTQGNLYLLTVNGRIRESVGARHHDMANILIEAGVVQAMGFDPGGSSTLVVGGKTLNISPYNSDYEYDVYALPPEPRAVSNAIIGWLE